LFALKFFKDDPNLIIAGGWDKSIFIYDIREKGGPAFHIFGPELCSNAIDSCQNMIVTGSYRPLDSLQIWDI